MYQRNYSRIFEEKSQIFQFGIKNTNKKKNNRHLSFLIRDF